jgi:hypothetical protein
MLTVNPVRRCRPARALEQVTLTIDDYYLCCDLRVSFRRVGRALPATEYDPPESPDVVIESISLVGNDGCELDVPPEQWGLWSVTTWERIEDACREDAQS